MLTYFQLHVTRWLRLVMLGTLLITLSSLPQSAAHAQDGGDVNAQQPLNDDLQAVDVEAALKDVPPGYMLIDGDIQIRITDYERYTAARDRALAAGESPQPLGTFITTNFWPGGNVAYEFDANVSATNRTTFRSAMDQWEAVANVTFTQCASNNCAGGNYIHVQSSTGNNSAVGMQGGQQIINIVSWTQMFRQAHELGHSLAFYHEQSRTDRDTYVTINWANIQSGKEGNFNLVVGSGRYGPYDFDSVMHYGRDYFSSNGLDTITVNDPWNAQWQNAIGQRDHLSDMDKLTMSFLYPQSNWRFADGNYTGLPELGTFFNPAKTLANGVGFTPVGGTLWIQPDTYSAAGTYTKAMTWQAPLGGVVLH
jgi:hypothetical protein